MLGSNGSDAVEAALKMARQYHHQSPDPADRERYKVFSLRGSYHGFSYGSLSTSGLESDSEKFGPLLPGFIQIEPPYCYRCPYGKEDYPGCELACANALE
jgi:taurine-pyruvate aminotransferase